MIAPIDVASLPGPAQKLLSPSAPPKLKEMAARGIAPGLKPADVISVLVALAAGDSPALAETANSTLSALPNPVLTGALGADLPPAAIDALAKRYPGRVDVLEKLLAMPRLDMDTALDLAQSGSEAVTELLATNEERLLKSPRLIVDGRPDRRPRRAKRRRAHRHRGMERGKPRDQGRAYPGAEPGAHARRRAVPGDAGDLGRAREQHGARAR
jgi:hypothetical protein